MTANLVNGSEELAQISPGRADTLGSPQLAVIIPTYNEAGNVAALVEKLDASLTGISWEAIFVDDDSTDTTLDELGKLCSADRRIRYLHRIGRRGLSSAVVEGMLATNAPYLGVIDGDLQHDETRLPTMLKLLQAGDCDVVVGSRYVAEGGFGKWARHRQLISIAATKLAQFVLPFHISDPMSGYFMLTRAAFMRSVRRLSNQGYKILLDIILSSPDKFRVKEVSYVFRNRVSGESKLDSNVIFEYLLMLIDKTIGHLVPVRFVLFGAVGGTGVLVHMTTLALCLSLAISFSTSQAIGTFVAMTFNFFINNTLTYRDKRLKGFWPIIKGLLSFYVVCSLGAVSNVGVASVLFERNYSWWLSGLAGILMGVVWNYAMTATFTWRK